MVIAFVKPEPPATTAVALTEQEIMAALRVMRGALYHVPAGEGCVTYRSRVMSIISKLENAELKNEFEK